MSNIQYPDYLLDALDGVIQRIEKNWEEKNQNSTQQDILNRQKYVQNCLVMYIKTATELGYINKDNFCSVANSLNKIESINALPYNERVVYGATNEKNGKLQIKYNPDLRDYVGMPYGSRSKMYLYHELGHCFAMQDSIAFDIFLDRDPALQRDDCIKNKEIAKDGKLALEEFVVQNIAEDVLYSQINKPRPKRRLYINPAMFGDENGNSMPFSTRLDFYGEFEQPGLAFANTLKGVGDYTKYKNQEAFLQSLAHDFFFFLMTPNCCKDIITEYKMSQIEDKEYNLFLTLYSFGNLFNAKYATFGAGKFKNSTINTELSRLSFEIIQDNGASFMDAGKKAEWSQFYPNYLTDKDAEMQK